MKRNTRVIIMCLMLALIFIFTTACGSSGDETDTSSKKEDVTSSQQDDTSSKKPSSSASSNSSNKNSSNESSSQNDETYYEGDKKALLSFNKGLDMFGEKSINIIGDSISQGLNSEKMYDQSWASLLKKSLYKKYGSNNIGYVSLLDGTDQNGFVCKEIHTITDKTGNWTKKYGVESSLTPGNLSYTASSFTEGATLEFKLNRKADGIDRHINGFYVYHVAGATYGKYQVKVNGQVVTTVDCAQATSNTCARSPYIAIPAGCGDDITIEIVKLTNGYEPVTITGISYIDKPGAVTVNNYSISGIRLVDIDDSVLEQLAKANFVIFTLGTNDAGTNADIDEFQRKVNIVVNACKKNGSTLIVGDVVWARYGNDYWATGYKNILRQAAVDANGYFIDFTTLPLSKVLKTDKDICHPTIEGHKLMAEKLCSFFELKLD